MTLTILASILAAPTWAGTDAEGPTTAITTSGTIGANGWWHSTVTATISCTPAPCSPETRLDGGPWTTYADALVVTEPGTHTLEARASDGGTTGPTAITTLRIDTAPPQTSALVAGTLGRDGWLTDTATVSFTCTDDASGCAATQFSLDGQPSGPANGPIRVTGDGTHPLRYRSSDVAGHRESVRERLVPIDGTPPSVGLTPSCAAMGNDDWCRGTVTVAASADDETSGVVSSTCHLDDEPVACTPLDITTDGTHAVAITAQDAAGHTSSHTTTIRVDATPPTLAFTTTGAPGPDGTFIGPVTVHATCSDATSGCATLHLGDAPEPEWDGTLTLESDGTHTLSAFARDTAGNTGPSSSIQITIDTTGPTPRHAVSGPLGDAGWFTGPTTVALDCSDDVSGCTTITYRVNDGATATYTAPFTIDTDASRHDVDYEATDAAGNTGPTNTLRFGLDATPPTVQADTRCATPGADGWCLAGLTWHVDARDATSGIRSTECRVDDASVPCDTVWATDGAFILMATATDHAGWSTTTMLELRRDTTAPAIDFGGHCPAIGQDDWCAAPVTLDPRITDDASGVASTLCLQQGTATPCDGLVAGRTGATTFTLQATDHAGNGQIDTARYLVDLKAPTIVADVTCASGWNGDWCTGPVALGVQAVDDASGIDDLVCLLDGAVVPCRPHSALGDGRHDLVVQARDRAGHVASRSIGFGIDTTAPELLWSRPAGGCTYVLDEAQACDGPATVAIGPLTLLASGDDDVSGVARLTVTIDGRVRHTSTGPELAWTWAEPEPVNAHHRVAVTAEDVAGNRAMIETRIIRMA